ncbi:MAG: T9SS type A sorting domain-containing protein, partial [Bacteroidales bacterium]|nr:T9SS type A sorting domain-containing protein [Bacteroidales bacterium]
VNAEDGKEVGEVDAVSLYSMAGEKMAEVSGGATIDVTTLPAGVYMVRVELRNGDIRYLKLVKE